MKTSRARVAHMNRTRDIREIIDSGLEALAETMDMLRAVPVDDRLDQVYLKGLTACTRAAVEIAKDQRDAADFLARQRLDDASLNKLLREHLAKMPPEQLAELLPRFGDTMAFALVVSHIRQFRERREVSGVAWVATDADVELIQLVEMCGAERE